MRLGLFSTSFFKRLKVKMSASEVIVPIIDTNIDVIADCCPPIQAYIRRRPWKSTLRHAERDDYLHGWGMYLTTKLKMQIVPYEVRFLLGKYFGENQTRENLNIMAFLKFKTSLRKNKDKYDIQVNFINLDSAKFWNWRNLYFWQCWVGHLALHLIKLVFSIHVW